MAWDDVPAKLVRYDAAEYADDSKGTLPSVKLIRLYSNGTGNVIEAIPLLRRDDFELELNYRLGAVENLAKSKAIRPEKLLGNDGKP